MSRSSTSRSTVVAAAVVVALVIVGVVAAQLLGGDDETTASSPSGDASAAASPTAEQPPPGKCNDAPEPPGTPKQYDAPPDAALAEGATWTAHVYTNCGEITVELDGARAPQTVASFLSLARDGYWVDSPCHRLVTSGIFVLQCGDPSATGGGGPGYGYGVENAPQDGQYPRGTLAMARTTDPNSNGGQFFVVYQDTQIPDPTGYSIFGRVVKGMDIVDRIADQGVGGNLGPEAPKQPISILQVTVEKA